MYLTHLLPAALAAVVTAQSSGQNTSQSSSENLGQVLAANPDLSTFTQLLMGQTELMNSLNSASNITIIAPNNMAFQRFQSNSTAQAASMSANPSMLTQTLSYHVITRGAFTADQITDKPVFLQTMLTDTKYVNVTGGQKVKGIRNGDKVMFVSGDNMNSTVVKADTTFKNGVIHITDTVLTIPKPPSTTCTDLGLTSLASALTQAGLISTVDDLRDVTIFAPTNMAFQGLGSSIGNLTKDQLASILTYHVVTGPVGYSTGLKDGMMLTTVNGGQVRVSVKSDGRVMVNGARVVVADGLVGNGVVHVIDGVLNPSNATHGSGNGSTPNPHKGAATSLKSATNNLASIFGPVGIVIAGIVLL